MSKKWQKIQDPSLNELSDDAHIWLGEYLSMTGHNMSEVTNSLTSDMIDNFELFKHRYGPFQSIIVYRGMERINDDIYKTKNISSWSYSQGIAERFGPHVYMTILLPDEVLVDTTLFASLCSEHSSGFAEEEEVIALPGEYKVSLVE